MRASVIIFVLLLAAGCASSSDKSGPPKRPGMDRLCYDDCLGAGSTKEVCEDRCSY